ncbi:MAG: AbgT family transporter, partial [Phycisphaerales bacterium]|nr:AbgT family transporter [Phycisphaerales bacterium]
MTTSPKPPSSPPPTPSGPRGPGGVLDLIERIGNRIPEPAVLFALFAALVIVVAAIGSAAGWSVQPVQPRVTLVEKLD